MLVLAVAWEGFVNDLSSPTSTVTRTASNNIFEMPWITTF
jgi:hypothetical protein